MQKIILLIILTASSMAYSQTTIKPKINRMDGSIYSSTQCRVDSQLCPQDGQVYCEYVRCTGPVWSPYCKVADTYCKSPALPQRSNTEIN